MERFDFIVVKFSSFWSCTFRYGFAEMYVFWLWPCSPCWPLVAVCLDWNLLRLLLTLDVLDCLVFCVTNWVLVFGALSSRERYSSIPLTSMSLEWSHLVLTLIAMLLFGSSSSA